MDLSVLETSASSYSGSSLVVQTSKHVSNRSEFGRKVLATVWCLDTGCGSVLYVLRCHKYSNINPLVISNRICNKSARIRTPNSRSNTGTNGGWTIVDGVSKSPALLVRHVKILCLSRGRFSEFGLIRVCPMGVPSSSKRNRWLARQASECQRNSSRIASIIARGQTGALYDRHVVLSSRDDDVFIKNHEEEQQSPIHAEMRRCLETSSSLDRCWPRFVLEWDWMLSQERATLVRGICAVAWRSAERAIMLDRPRKHQEMFCPMLRIITTSACFVLRVLANVNTVAIRGYVRVKRVNTQHNIPRPDIVLSFFSVVHAWLLPLLEDVATGLSGTFSVSITLTLSITLTIDHTQTHRYVRLAKR